MSRTVRILLGLVPALLCEVASAEVARFHYEAVVMSVDLPAGHPIQGRLEVGDSIGGTLQYDLALADELGHMPEVGSYEALPAGSNRFRATGGDGFVFDSSFIPRPFFVATVDDGLHFDTLLVHMSGDTMPSTLERPDTRFVEMGLLLETTDTGAFASDGLPRQLSLDQFGLAGIDFFGTGTAFPTFLVHTTITTLDTLPSLPAGDFSGNGRVEQGDLDLVLLNWGKEPGIAETPWAGLAPGGLIDQEELDAVLLGWGAKATGTAAVPEPSAASLAGLIAAALALCGIRHVAACCQHASSEPAR
jgi:hypothetical protein